MVTTGTEPTTTTTEVEIDLRPAGACPRCGRCPHCGYSVPTYPPSPWWPTPWPPYPVWGSGHAS